MNELRRCSECKTIFQKANFNPSNDISKEFRKWSLKNHPDKGGNNDTFKEVSGCQSVFKLCQEHRLWEPSKYIPSEKKGSPTKKANPDILKKWVKSCFSHQIFDLSTWLCVAKTSKRGQYIIKQLKDAETWVNFVVSMIKDADMEDVLGLSQLKSNLKVWQFNTYNNYKFDLFRSTYLTQKERDDLDGTTKKSPPKPEYKYSYFKYCDVDKIFNPQTLKCVIKKGAIGKHIIEQLKTVESWKKFILTCPVENLNAYGFEEFNNYKFDLFRSTYLTQKERDDLDRGSAKKSSSFDYKDDWDEETRNIPTKREIDQINSLLDQLNKHSDRLEWNFAHHKLLDLFLLTMKDVEHMRDYTAWVIEPKTYENIREFDGYLFYFYDRFDGKAITSSGIWIIYREGIVEAMTKVEKEMFDAKDSYEWWLDQQKAPKKASPKKKAPKASPKKKAPKASPKKKAPKASPKKKAPKASPKKKAPKASPSPKKKAPKKTPAKKAPKASPKKKAPKASPKKKAPKASPKKTPAKKAPKASPKKTPAKKAPKASPVKKKCPPGKIENPATKRCVSKTGKIGKTLESSPKKDPKKSPIKKSSEKASPVKKTKCPPGKIENPATKRCVSKTGKIGKTIPSPKKSPAKKSPPKKGSVKKCPPEKILNPASGKCVLRTGKIGKKLV
jgi:hypothetical protein